MKVVEKQIKNDHIHKIIDAVSALVVDDKKRTDFQFVCTYLLLGIVAVFMSVMNIFTRKGFLTLYTGVFAVMCIVNVVLTRGNRNAKRLSRILFSCEIILLFTVFIVSGNPEGFSAIWTIMLPSLGLLLFGIGYGSILGGVMFLILVFFYWTGVGQAILKYDYTATFCMRFPVLYVAFYAMGLLLEVIRMATFRNYKYLCTHDPLTSALNRNGFKTFTDESINDNTSGKISFLIFDLDHFKRVNDSLGHFTGDEVLRQTVARLSEITGLNICRWGGEEFAAIDPTGSITEEMADSFVSEFAKSKITVDGKQIPITISLGCVTIDCHNLITADKMGVAADGCLYVSKETGRNRATFRTISADELMSGKSKVMEELENGKPDNYSDIHDELTGLPSRRVLEQRISSELEDKSDEEISGNYAAVFFDISKFKLINERYGKKEGDNLLVYLAQLIESVSGSDKMVARCKSDDFAMFLKMKKPEVRDTLDTFYARLADYKLGAEVVCNAGIFMLTGKITGDAAIDRAVLALNEVKGNYVQKYEFYSEEHMARIVEEQEITAQMNDAMANGEFVAYLQPQYNHSTGMLVGAEALARWKHPEKGLIPPIKFIPVFEKNGFIYQLDMCIFEQVCAFLKDCRDNGLPMIPISVNFSKADAFETDFIANLENIRNKYGIETKYLRLELTETAIVIDIERVKERIEQLHSCGYIIEMDDFGSGDSSLNVLKDLDIDVLKMDMRFLEKSEHKERSGLIVSAVARMTNWLHLPMIAEGVETPEEADFLRSVGCSVIQGYLYSKPIPIDEYRKLLSGPSVGIDILETKLEDYVDSGAFWAPESYESLLFNSIIGGAAVFEWTGNKSEVIRVNRRYIIELGMNMTEKDLIGKNIEFMFDDEDREEFAKAVNTAVETHKQQIVETWRNIESACCGKERLKIRSEINVIGQNGDISLIFANIKNVTDEALRNSSILESERRFKMASEQANIYYWEYTINTKEMRPCFRCMRDLGLPPLVTNYPEPAIEAGIFPPDYADMYRDWHRQLAAGVPSLEAVIPLTVGRVPFTVRYTTEFDENGHPVKAYGSATLVV